LSLSCRFDARKHQIMIGEKSVIYGEKLKRLRINQFISQREMAIKFKMSQQAYSLLEKGKIKFTIKKIEKICKLFKLSTDEFILISPKLSKVKDLKTDNYNIKILKKYYERLLLIKDIRIGELEIENKRLKKGRKISKTPLDVHVMSI